MPSRQLRYDLVKFGSCRLEIPDGKPESVDKRQLFLDRLGAVDVTVCFRVGSVIPCLFDQMAAVGGRIDQNIVGLCFHAALNNGFQIFIFDFKFNIFPINCLANTARVYGVKIFLYFANCFKRKKIFFFNNFICS